MHLIVNNPDPAACPIPWCIERGQHYGHRGAPTGPLDHDPDTGEVSEAAQARLSAITGADAPLVELLVWQADDTEAGEGMHHFLTSAEARELARALDRTAARADRITRHSPVA